MTARKMAYSVLFGGLQNKIADYEIVAGYGNTQNTNSIAISVLQETQEFIQSENKTDNDTDSIRNIKLMFNLNVKLNKVGFGSSKTESLYENAVQDVINKIDVAFLDLQSEIGRTETEGRFTSTLNDISWSLINTSELIDTDTLQFFGTIKVTQIIT